MSDLVGNPNCWFSQAKAHNRFIYLSVCIKSCLGDCIECYIVDYQVFIHLYWERLTLLNET